MKGVRPAADWPQMKCMNKELKEMIEKLDHTDPKDVDTDTELLGKVMEMFSDITESENNALIAAAGEKLADVFTLDTLKDMDQHFITSEVLSLLISANTVSSDVV